MRKPLISNPYDPHEDIEFCHRLTRFTVAPYLERHTVVDAHEVATTSERVAIRWQDGTIVWHDKELAYHDSETADRCRDGNYMRKNPLIDIGDYVELDGKGNKRVVEIVGSGSMSVEDDPSGRYLRYRHANGTQGTMGTTHMWRESCLATGSIDNRHIDYRNTQALLWRPIGNLRTQGIESSFTQDATYSVRSGDGSTGLITVLGFGHNSELGNTVHIWQQAKAHYACKTVSEQALWDSHLRVMAGRQVSI